MSRTLVALTALLALAGCGLLDGAPSVGQPLDALASSSASLAEVQPRMAESVTTLLERLQITLDPDDALPDDWGATLVADLAVLVDARDELRWRRDRMQEVGAEVAERWEEQAAFLPERSLWRDPADAANKRAALEQQLSELDAQLFESEQSLSVAITLLREPLEFLALDVDDERVDAQRPALVAALPTLRALPAQLEAGAARLADFAHQLGAR